jgi:phage FluMu protein Com
MRRYITCPDCHDVMRVADYQRHLITKCPHSRTLQLSTQSKQREAAALGKHWVEIPCTGCGANVPIHVEWRQPLPMCKECRMKRRLRLIAVRATKKAHKALRPHVPTEGSAIGGGLPGLGKRR